MPFKIGFDLAGTVAVVGDEVTRVKVGDEVFCCLPFKDRGLLHGVSRDLPFFWRKFELM